MTRELLDCVSGLFGFKTAKSLLLHDILTVFLSEDPVSEDIEEILAQTRMLHQQNIS